MSWLHMPIELKRAVPSCMSLWIISKLSSAPCRVSAMWTMRHGRSVVCRTCSSIEGGGNNINIYCHHIHCHPSTRLRYGKAPRRVPMHSWTLTRSRARTCRTHWGTRSIHTWISQMRCDMIWCEWYDMMTGEWGEDMTTRSIYQRQRQQVTINSYQVTINSYQVTINSYQITINSYQGLTMGPFPILRVLIWLDLNSMRHRRHRLSLPSSSNHRRACSSVSLKERG